MTTHPLTLSPHEVRAALRGELGLVVRPVKPQPIEICLEETSCETKISLPVVLCLDSMMAGNGWTCWRNSSAPGTAATGNNICINQGRGFGQRR